MFVQFKDQTNRPVYIRIDKIWALEARDGGSVVFVEDSEPDTLWIADDVEDAMELVNNMFAEINAEEEGEMDR